MSFQLDEAPNMVLSAIRNEAISRGCGTFWTIACTLPTLGLVFCCIDRRAEGGAECGPCCLPMKNSIETDGSLDALKKALENEVLYDKSKFPAEESKRKIIEWQVMQTLNLLKTTLDKGLITGDYKRVLEIAQREIQSRVNAESSYKTALETTPLTGHQVELNDYTMQRTNNKS